VLVILAQNGYTREAHKIISLSRIASLIGRDSDGGLPELWDVMGKVRNKRRITRLMAICITSGSLSPQRALSLIRDHNVDVSAKDYKRRTALHHAVGARHWKDPWPEKNLINADLIRVLLEACPSVVKMEDDEGYIPLYYACDNNAPFDVIKQLLDIYPEGLQNANFGKLFLKPSTLVALSYEKVVKENSYAAGYVARALHVKAMSFLRDRLTADRQACIDARVPLALTDLAREKVVKENSSAARDVASAISHISYTDTEGRQSCIDAGATLALTELAREKVVKENDHAAYRVAGALGNIAKSETGRQSCIDAGAALALTELAR
jgi:ankyrin repeat protein